MQQFKMFYILALLLYCAVTDVRIRKIKNRSILAGLAGGIFFLLCTGSVAALWDGISAMGFVFLIFFPLFALRMLGAGDVKLISAAALYTGWDGLQPFLLGMLAAGGVISLGKLMLYGTVRKRLRCFLVYAKGVFLTHQLSDYGIPEEKKETVGMAFPVFAGMLCCWIKDLMIL